MLAGGFLLAAGGILPVHAFAQTCTVGPFTSSTALSDVSTKASAAANGAVVCLTRGNTWTAGSGLLLTSSHPDSSRVTICASTGSACSDSGAANPKIVESSNASNLDSPNGRCVRVGAGGGGFNFKNLDCDSSVGSEQAWDIDETASNITVEGGKTKNYKRLLANFTSGGGNRPTNIHFGTCANRHEYSNNPPITGSNSGFIYGGFINSTFSVWFHDLSGRTDGSAAQSHMIDFDVSGGTPANGTLNQVIECSLIEFNGTRMGNLIKPSRGTNMTIQDSVFRVTTSMDGDVIGVGTHNGAGTEGQIGLTIRRNRFEMPGTVWSPIGLSNAQQVVIENNVAILPGQVGGGFQHGFIGWQGNTTGNGIALSDITIRNNTVYRTGAGGTSGSGMLNEAGGSISAFSNVSVYNNLFYDLGAGSATIFSMGVSGCGGYGSNGSNIKNNWVYTPNDSTPSLANCSGTTWANSAPYNQDPGLVDAANGNFALATTSPLKGKGISASALTTDIMQNARPSPPSIGAYDVSSDGGTPALQPPVLIQISGN